MSSESPGHPVKQWQQLVHAVVLGSDRSARPPSGVDRIEAIVERAKPEEAWLSLVTAMSLYIRAGYMPAKAEAIVQPLSGTGDVVCSATAASALDRILHDGFTCLLDVWCQAASHAGRVAPPEYIPAMLDVMCSRNAGDLIQTIRSVVGERGRWLKRLMSQEVDQNEDPTDAHDIWETGTTEQRLMRLRTLRHTDPAEGLRLLQSTWSTESHEDRATFLSDLEVGLGPDDEPFLEASLDDKRKPVRQEAARLLAALPGSALSRRVSGRAREMVSLTSSWRGRKLKVVLPEAADAQLKRDGIEARKRSGMGERAAMLSAIVAASPLETWSDAEPDQWIGAANKTDWAEALLRGWCASAHREKHGAWAHALAERYLATLPPDQHSHWQQELCAVLPCVEQSVLTKLVAGQVRKHGLYGSRLWLEAVEHWPADLSKLVLEGAKKLFRKPDSNYDWMLRDWLKEYGVMRLSILLASEAGKGWPTDADHWNNKLAEMAERIEQGLRLRQIIDKEFSS